MARHTPGQDDRITIAQLDGTARRLLNQGADRDTSLNTIHAISTNPRTLGHAAGAALGSWQADNLKGHDGDRVARMLAAAGADESVRDEVARQVRERLQLG